jgi:probable HAF family extracellular repeat protein
MRPRRLRTSALLVGMSLLACPIPNVAEGHSFEPLFHPLARSLGTFVDASGGTVVGLFPDDDEAFVWTRAGGFVRLGRLPNFTTSYATGVSDDGSTVVGVSSDGVTTRGFVRSAATGLTALPQPNGDDNSLALGTSADGSVVVGFRWSEVASIQQAFRWTNSTGFTSLGVLPGDDSSWATAVSANGSVIVGFSQNTATGISRAFRWTAGAGMASLGVLSGDDYSEARAVSADGSVVVGFSQNSTTAVRRAFRWTAASGMVDLGFHAGADFASATGVSGDGSVVVGKAGGAAAAPFIWTASTGMRSLRAVLQQSGVNLTGWQLVAADGIARNGATIVGHGWDPSGAKNAWTFSGATAREQSRSG